MNILASLFNLGGPDLIVILLLALLLFGAKKLPELARGMGLAMKEFHKAKEEFDRETTKPVADVPIQPVANPNAQPISTQQNNVPQELHAPALPLPPSTNLPS